MQITLDRAALTRELSLLAGVAGKASTIPILASVRIEAGEGARLTCTDLECGVVSAIPAEVKEEGAACVNVKRLLDFVRTLAGDSLELTLGPNNYLTAKCGKARARIPGTSAESYPELPKAPEPIVTLDARALARQLARVVFAISQEASRFSVNGLLADLKDRVLTCVATDGHRLAHATSIIPDATAHLLVPSFAVPIYSKMADTAEGGATVALSQDDNHLFFAVGHRVMFARKLAATFPDYARVLPAKYAPNITVEAAALKAALDSVRQFGETKSRDSVSRSVRLTVSEGELGVSAASVDAGECENFVPCKYEGGGLAAGFNPDYIADFLAATGTDEIEVCILDGKSAAEMRPVGDDHYRYILMPMRI